MASLISKSLFLVFSFSMICLSFSIPNEHSILNYDHDLDKFTSEEDIFQLFQAWQKEYGRSYQTLEEELKRFEIFKSNLKYIVAKNARRTSPYDYRLGLNVFSDLTYEEFSKTHLGEMEEPILIEGNMSHIVFNSNPCSDAPVSLDWRDFGAVTPVKDQGICGSCWAFSATGAIEGINKIATGDLVSVSEQQLVSCGGCCGCLGGFYNDAFEYVINNDGIALETDYPYMIDDGICNHQLEQKKAVTIDGYEKMINNTEDSLFCAVAKQPISVSLFASEDFQHYKSGILDARNCTNLESCKINHAVLIVGYGSLNGQDYWIVKNSWGTKWGQDGYFYIKRNTSLVDGVCNLNCHAAYPIKQIVTKLDSTI